MSSRGSEPDRAAQVPRAVIHKQILEAAESRPDASVEALAVEVTGASADLVERVLEEYGDPCETEPEPTGGSPTEIAEGSSSADDGTDTMSDAGQHQPPQLEQLTETQVELLREIRKQPTATQRDLADAFDLSQATISNHLNAIAGFDWNQREAFAREMLSDDTEPKEPESVHDAETAATLVDAVDELAGRIEALEARLDEASDEAGSGFDDPVLAAKLVRACVDDDDITEDEELRIIEELVVSG